MNSAGSSLNSTIVYYSYAVRPSLHLNLTSAALAAGLESHVSTLWKDFTEDYKSVPDQGSGEKPDSPYLISTAGQLAKVAENVNKGEDCGSYFKLSQDIYLGGRQWTPIGTDDNPFVGTFDGNGHTIYGLKVRAKEANQGLFGVTGENAEILGVIINGGSVLTSVSGYGGALIGKMAAAGKVFNCYAISIDVDGINYVGGMIGYAEGEFSYLTSSCDVKGNNHVGGVFGYFKDGSFSNVVFSNIVEGNNNVGGIMGYLNKGTVGPVTSTCQVVGNDNVGGVVGHNQSATLSSLSHSGEVEGRDNVGGVVGENLGSSSTSLSNTGKVSGNNNVGGVIGKGQGTIKTISSTGTIFGKQYVGGVIGYLNSGTLTLSDSDTTINGTSDLGGIAGYCGGTISNSVASCHIKGTNEYGGLVGILQSGALTDCAGFGSLYGGIDFVGCLVGKNNSRTVTSCSYVGDSNNRNVRPFGGTGTGTYKYCYSIINQNKYISTDSSDSGWIDYWGVISSLQSLPLQKNLYWIVSVDECPLETLQACFADFGFWDKT